MRRSDLHAILGEEGLELAELDLSIVVADDKPEVWDESFPVSLAELGEQSDAVEKSEKVVASLNEGGNTSKLSSLLAI